MVTHHTAKNLKEKSGCDKKKSFFFFFGLKKALKYIDSNSLLKCISTCIMKY
jgi:hypothetical protein